MIYRFRIIPDTQEDVFRDLEIEDSASLEDFHYAIAQALVLEVKWFLSTPPRKLEQGEELPLLTWGKERRPWQEKSRSIFQCRKSPPHLCL